MQNLDDILARLIDPVTLDLRPVIRTAGTHEREVAHRLAIGAPDKDGMIRTIEGNTDSTGSREGGGVFDLTLPCPAKAGTHADARDRRRLSPGKGTVRVTRA